MSPSPILGSIIKKSKALQVLKVEDHQKTRYKPISFNDTILQTSKTKDKAHKLQRIKPTSLQASKVHPTNFKGIIPQASKDKAHKLPRTKFKPTKQWLTTTSFKASKLKFKSHQAVAHNNKLQEYKAQVTTHNNKLEGSKAQVQSPPSSGPQHLSFKASKLRFKAHQVVARNTQVSKIKFKRQSYGGLQQQGSKI
jgi:hypothetical protein